MVTLLEMKFEFCLCKYRDHNVLKVVKPPACDWSIFNKQSFSLLDAGAPQYPSRDCDIKGCRCCSIIQDHV